MLAAASLVSVGLVGAVALGSGVAGAVPVSPTARDAALPASDWPAYLDGPLHASYNASQTAITPATAPALTQKWRLTRGAPYTASPTVADGAVYIGSATGEFYKLSEKTGEVLDKTYLGHQPALTCPANGITSTATVAPNPASHVMTVYVAGADGYLYALKASTLKREWRSVIGIPSTTKNNYYDWSSPTVANGKIYVGIASSCDRPLVRGGVIAFDQASGAKLAEFYTVPAGRRNAGGSVWSSVGVAPNGDVYATTGNGPRGNRQLQNSESIVKLAPDTLRLLRSYKVPANQVVSDGDFGSSPVFFGSYVGACNKNGVFYALRQANMRLAWQQAIATAAGSNPECLAAPAYNGTDLFIGGTNTTIDGTAYPGSLQERLASTGTLVWSTGLPGAVLGSPTLDGGGVLAVGVYSAAPASVYLFDASSDTTSGDIVSQLTGSATFAQSVFADDWLFTANSKGVTAWGPPTS